MEKLKEILQNRAVQIGLGIFAVTITGVLIAKGLINKSRAGEAKIAVEEGIKKAVENPIIKKAVKSVEDSTKVSETTMNAGLRP